MLLADKHPEAIKSLIHSCGKFSATDGESREPLRLEDLKQGLRPITLDAKIKRRDRNLWFSFIVDY